MAISKRARTADRFPLEGILKVNTKTTVYLYEVSSWGYNVTCDIWIEDHHDHWEKHHGIFASESNAERKRQGIIDELLKDGYALTPDGGLYGPHRDAYVTIKELEIEPTDIAVDGKGKYSYKGKEVTL